MLSQMQILRWKEKSRPVLFIAISFLLLILSCQKEANILKPDHSQQSIKYLVFGHFYGKCLPEKCVEIFLLKNDSLFEDRLDRYPKREEVYVGEYVLIDQKNVSQLMGLFHLIPEQLFTVEEHVIGCPDCMDQGGIYLEYEVNGEQRFWIIDQNINSIPEYLHKLVKEINEKIALVNI